MMAEVFVIAGNCTVNVVVEVLSAPKSSTQIAPLSPDLYIKAPHAVSAEVHTALLNEIYATDPLPTVGVWEIVSACPPAV